MKRKIFSALLLLFLSSASGVAMATYLINHSTANLGRLLKLHQIEDIHQQLILSVQAVQTDLNDIQSQPGNIQEIISKNFVRLKKNASRCNGCHHQPVIAAEILGIENRIDAYQSNLDDYTAVSDNPESMQKLQGEATEIGTQLLHRTELMSSLANRNLESMTDTAMVKINRAREILYLTIAITFLFGAGIAFHLIRLVTDPIDRLVSATRALAAGDHPQIEMSDDKTEFGELAGYFNAMSNTIGDNYLKLQQEIEERQLAEEALLESEERYALAASGANDGLWDLDIRKNTIYYSYRWKSMLGFKEDEIGTSLNEWLSRLHETDRGQVEAKLAAHINGQISHFECEYRIRHKDNSFRWMLARGLAVRDEKGAAYRMAGSQTDITSRKSVEQQLIHNAFHDTLTNLPNRALFMDRLQHVINSARRHHHYRYAVLFTDLDRFKVINDSMGHEIGDKLLVEVGRRLLTCLRPGDTVARLGGDEFAILLEDIGSKTDAESIAKRILDSLRQPFQIDGKEFFTSQSIGIALNSERYDEPDVVVRDADIAMYQAKANGGARYVFFDSKMHISIVNRNQLEADLRAAIEEFSGFVLHYQPIMDLRDNSLTGFEALVRWNHPSRGLIQPLEFIPLAEETGMIIPLSKWILRQACSQLHKWQELYSSVPPIRMSVNITSRLLLLPGFVEYVKSCFQEFDLNPNCLALEITESTLMEHTKAAEEALIKLQDLGVHIHIDDFGTGYSSLSYLHNFPVDALKIDSSFITKMSGSDENHEIVKTIIDLARHLKLKVIAEGVEQYCQLSTILGMECNYGQGFLFSKPLTADDISLWIKDNSVKFS